MLYPKNKNKELSKELFENPTAEYRGTPFWAWNSDLNKDELARQIQTFKKMGFGGFHMHVRQGLTVPYMSKEFLSAVSFCTETAESLDMLAWLYDEDRWPSGVAGGEVTKTLKHRQKFLTMTRDDKVDCAKTPSQAAETGKPYFIAAFDLSIDSDGKMTDYKKVDRTANCQNKVYFFLCQQQGGEPRYNYQSYVDTLSKSAIDEFIELTHEKFKDAVGNKFGKTIPAIFTDEPLFIANFAPKSAFDTNDVCFAWTTDFADTFKAEYSFDLTDRLPELFFETNLESAPITRYDYFTHLSERFCSAYMDNIGDWCEKNGIALTGHLMGEDTLYEQILSNGDVMRTYKNMQLPGIDLLCDDKDFNTAIQCRSVVRQYGREAMLSELYGVTGWDFDFRGHKYQGDWQACLGVTVRVPHLAWQSMKGEGKRDYPAPISYQSPWHEEYKYIEDHYARINTAMTRGVPQVNIAIVHPIDSYKTIYASLSETDAIRAELENNFKDTADWLLSEGFDFDYISESLLPDLCQSGTNPLTVGKMNYDVIILSDCMTLRPHTINILEQFKKSGGRLIIKGRTPYMCLGKKSEDAKALTNGASVIYNSKADLISLIKDVRAVDVRNEKGERVDNMMFTMRIDGDCKWLFGAHMHKPQLPNFINEQNLSVKVKGTFRPVLYDTLSGEIKDLCYTADKDCTTFYITLYDLDTVLVKLIPTTPNDKCVLKKEKLTYKPLYVPCEVDYSLTEPNALLLDVAKYSADGSPLTGPEEIMRIDAAVRKTFNLQSRRTKVVQPWAVPNAPEDHHVKLVYTISSQTDCDGVILALEHPHTTTITFNGASVPNTAVGYYVDRDIKTVKLPPLIKGENTLEISMPFGLRTDLESCYLIGNFGTEYHGSKTNIIPMQDKLCFGDVTRQGLAFYGGNIQYKTDIELEEDCDIQITISEYRGAMIKVLVDGNDVGRIAFPPFNLTVPNLKKGKHAVSFVLYGTRYNTFSALHNLFADKKRNYIGPDYWRTENEAWSYEYNTRPLGILKTPIIEVIKR